MIAVISLPTALIIQAKDSIQLAFHHGQPTAAEIMTDLLVPLMLTACQCHRLLSFISAAIYDRWSPIYIQISLENNMSLRGADLLLVKHMNVNMILCTRSNTVAYGNCKANWKAVYLNDAAFAFFKTVDY